MGDFKEYDRFDALGLAELVRQKQISPQDLCETAIARIEKCNPAINAVVTKMYAEGRRQAAAPLSTRPFAGVPFVIKDLHYAYAGYPLTRGCRALKNHDPGYDCELVSRLKAAGLLFIGKTNTPEFGLMGVTEPALFGPCRNPWNQDLSPGGSSGGSAAAVAAGMVPLASGGDGGGSIRIPASYCGLFGLKPSRGRTPNGPLHGQVWQGAVQNHVITRSVRDSAAMLDMLRGPDTGAPYIIRPPQRPYLEEVDIEPSELNIAFTTEAPIGTPVDPDCIRAVEETAVLLADLGHRVEYAKPELDGKALARSYIAMYFGEVAADIRQLGSVLGRRPRPADVEPQTWMLGLLGRTYSSGHFVEAIRCWDSAARRMGRFFNRYDLYLTPTTAQARIGIGELKPSPGESLLLKLVNSFSLGWALKKSGLVDQMAERSLSRTPFTQLANLCGLPAMSVPLYWTADEMPCGVQFVAPFGAEDLLFGLAGQLERARPWFHRRPPS